MVEVELISAAELTPGSPKAGEWVEVLDPSCAGVVGICLGDDLGSCDIETDWGRMLVADVKRRRIQKPPHRWFPMRRMLPYGRYLTDDGYVLFNRDYAPLFRVKHDGSWTACDQNEWIEHRGQEWIYQDRCTPWRWSMRTVNKATLRKCVAALPPTLQFPTPVHSDDRGGLPRRPSWSAEATRQ